MRTIRNSSGSTLIFFLVALSVLAVLAVGMQKISSISVINQLMFNQGNKARNLAYSGLEYTKGLISYCQSQSKTFQEFSESLVANDGTYDLGDENGTFKVSIITSKVNGNTTEFSVNITGQTPDGPNQAKYQIPSPIQLKYKRVASSPTITSTSSDQNVESEAKVNGDMVANSFHIKSKATVNGDIYSKTSIDIEQGALLNGNGCTISGDLKLKNGASVVGNVNINGDITLESSSNITGTVRLTGSLTLKNKSWIKGEIYSPLGYGGIFNGGTIYNSSGVVCGDSCVHISDSSVACDEISTPNPSSVTGATRALTLEQGQSNSTNPLKNGVYTYTSIQIKNGAELYIDISDGNPVTINVSGNVNIESSDQNNYKNILIKTNKSDGFVAIDSLIDNEDFENASLIYLKSDGTVNIKYKERWYGTIFARSKINFEQGVKVVGAYASPGSINIKHQVELVQYILAEQAW